MGRNNTGNGGERGNGACGGNERDYSGATLVTSSGRRGGWGRGGGRKGRGAKGESKGEAEMALGAAGRTPARAATPRGNTLRLGEPKGGGAAGSGAEGSRAYLACSAQHEERNRDGDLGGGKSLPARAMRGRESGGGGAMSWEKGGERAGGGVKGGMIG